MRIHPISAVRSAQGVVEEDLSYICSHLKEELACLSGKRLLITGGAGFLGYYLVQTISHWNKKMADQDSIRLTVYDKLIYGTPHWLKELQQDRSLAFVQHDICKPLPEDIGDFHYIIHAASIASPTYYRTYPIETMQANVNGLQTLLEYSQRQEMRGKGIEGFLFFSSSEIYGDPWPENIPTPESFRGYVSCTGPRACYDESKRYGETLCVNFTRQYDLSVKIVRPFNNYGPGLKITDRRVLPDFARDVLANKDIVLFSDGSPTRTFCYVADAVVGYYKALVKGRTGEAYNIGVQEPEISIGDLAAKVVNIAGDLLGYQGKIVRQVSSHADYLVDNPQRRCPLIAKARADLGYQPSTPLEEGLRRSLIWYRDNQDTEGAR